MSTKLNRSIGSLLLLASAACSASNGTTNADAGTSTPIADGGSATPQSDAAPPSTGNDAAADATDATASTPSWTTRVLATFDPGSGELPEGVTVKDGFAYAGFAPLGEIAKVDLTNGTKTTFATIPKPVAGKGFMTGLAFGADGMLYAALVSFDPSVRPGIYRVPSSGGPGTLFAKDAKMVFPNGLVFDASGALFVTDSAAGTIFKIDSSGAVAAWASSDLLVGDQKACGGSGNGFDIGANGLVAKDGAFYATNTDKGSVVRFAVQADGTAGPAVLAAGPDCATFSGADGITADKDGNLIIAVNRQNKIIRLTSSGAVAVVASGDAVDFPASLDWNGATLVATSFAFANASSGKPAHPGLVGITKNP